MPDLGTISSVSRKVKHAQVGMAGGGRHPLLNAAPGSAGVITGLYNTGVDASGVSLPDGTIGDPHYSLISVPGGSTTDIRVRTSAGGYPIPRYYGDSPTSAWTPVPFTINGLGVAGVNTLDFLIQNDGGPTALGWTNCRELRRPNRLQSRSLDLALWDCLLGARAAESNANPEEAFWAALR